jgi:hypothetical protein
VIIYNSTKTGFLEDVASGGIDTILLQNMWRATGSGVGEAQLRERPGVGRAHVEGEAVDAHGLGIVDVFGPLVGALAVREADLHGLVRGEGRRREEGDSLTM